MIKRDMESELHDALLRGTNGAARQKERVWRAIATGMIKNGKERINPDMKRRRSYLFAGSFAATFVIMAAVFFSLTPQGTALADRFIKFFEPEKKIQTPIEGTTETQNASLQGDTSGEVGYVIYIDSERYYKESRDGVDYYKALNMPEGYPSVQMEVRQLPGKPAQQAYEELLMEAKSQYDTVEGWGQVDEPVIGWSLMAYDEGGSDAPYEDAYIVDNKAGGCFVIRCKMFREASEGHGARYAAMLKTFEVVNSSQVQNTLQPGQSPSPAPSVAPSTALQPKKLIWDGLAFFGVKLGTDKQTAENALKTALPEAGYEAEYTAYNADSPEGASTCWEFTDGSQVMFLNGKLYSMTFTTPLAVLPNGLHAGMKLDEFKAVLGEPHEAVDNALAWGVGSNDNLIVTVEDGAVQSVKISLIA